MTADPARAMQSIVITGASSGIGEALALAHARAGTLLALSGRDRERLDRVADACRRRGAAVDAAVMDVTARQDMRDWIAAVDTRAPLELVIANAGISGGTANGGESEDQARKIFDVNITGTLNTVMPAIDLMRRRGGGQIALMSSAASFRGFPSAPAYSATKAAVRSYGEALRGALRTDGISVSVICPGFVRSRMTRANRFPMPFLMDSDRAAGIIKRGLARNRPRIAFPWPTYFVAWLIGCLPPVISDGLFNRLPKK